MDKWYVCRSVVGDFDLGSSRVLGDYWRQFRFPFRFLVGEIRWLTHLIIWVFGGYPSPETGSDLCRIDTQVCMGDSGAQGARAVACGCRRRHRLLLTVFCYNVPGGASLRTSLCTCMTMLSKQPFIENVQPWRMSECAVRVEMHSTHAVHTRLCGFILCCCTHTHIRNQRAQTVYCRCFLTFLLVAGVSLERCPKCPSYNTSDNILTNVARQRSRV